MPEASASTLALVLESWRMSVGSVHFLLFLPIVAGAYFLLPGSLRRGWLLLTSLYFYFFAAPRYLPVLLFGILWGYLFGRLSGTAKSQKTKKAAMCTGVLGLIAGLCLFKYHDFFSPALSPLFARLGIDYTGTFITAAAVGISYYTFTSIAYLVDVYHGETLPEKNLLNYALFISFFPSITTGPISRAGQLLPQLKDTSRKFDPQRAADALRLMAIGFFKKLAVADMLAIFVDSVYSDTASHGGSSILLAAILFTLQLYFDFSGYTDIVRGAAGLMGITLPENFQNPFFATNFSQFWARWHMSFSGWLQDYLFTPLVWSRWPEKLPFIGKRVQKPPVLSSLAIVFLVSGIWHGDGWCFLIWGALQAAFRIGEELLHRKLGKPKKRPPFKSRLGKTAVVLTLWCLSLIFFAVGMNGGTVAEALGVFPALFQNWSLTGLFADVYAAYAAALLDNGLFIGLVLAYVLFCTALALWADWAQCWKLRGKSLVTGLAALPTPLKWAAYYVLVLGSFTALLARGGGSFLYNNF